MTHFTMFHGKLALYGEVRALHRFFAPLDAFGAGHVSLNRETLDHVRVLRLGPRETFVVCNGAGRDYHCVLAGDLAEIVSVSDNLAEPQVRCTLYLAYTRGERMDYAIQKSVELGAWALRLFPAARCVVKYDEKSLSKKIGRWDKIALEAAKQAGRGRVPAVDAVPDYKTAMESAAQADLPLFFYENEREYRLRNALKAQSAFQTASLTVGPEGGFTAEEAASAADMGLRTVSLGRRILRAETAPVAALAALLFYAEP